MNEIALPLQIELLSPAPERPFRRTMMTYFTLGLIGVVFPISNILALGDTTLFLKTLGENPIALFYIPTILVLSMFFALVLITLILEDRRLKDIGFTPLRGVHLAQGMAFFMVMTLVFVGLEALLKVMGYGIAGEVELLLPDTEAERWWWVALSICAGIAEEAAFRGYLITRIRQFLPEKWSTTARWGVALVVSSVAFGLGHNYQGVGGMILITTYGAMLATLYIRTGSIWPCVIAHSMQDLFNIIIPIFGK